MAERKTKQQIKIEMKRLVNDRINQGVPLGIAHFQFLISSEFGMSLEALEAHSEVEHELSNYIYEKVCKGMDLEKEGKIDEAITAYEDNVHDWFVGNYPYDRLRVLYSSRKQYDDAIRVCRAFTIMADKLIELGSPRSDLRPKKQKFLVWIEKLEKKKSKS